MRTLLAVALLSACSAPTADRADPILGKADALSVPVHFWQWESATNVFPADADPAPDADHDANHCELYLNAIGRGEFSNGGVTVRWLEAYLSVPEQLGDVVDVGMFVVTGSTTDGNHVMFGEEIEPAYWRTGFTYASNGSGGHNHSIDQLALFVDVERPDGTEVRLWQSRQGRNYRLADAFTLPTFDKPIGGGTIQYANAGSAVFDQKRACD